MSASPSTRGFLIRVRPLLALYAVYLAAAITGAAAVPRPSVECTHVLSATRHLLNPPASSSLHQPGAHGVTRGACIQAPNFHDVATVVHVSPAVQCPCVFHAELANHGPRIDAHGGENIEFDFLVLRDTDFRALHETRHDLTTENYARSVSSTRQAPDMLEGAAMNEWSLKSVNPRERTVKSDGSSYGAFRSAPVLVNEFTPMVLVTRMRASATVCGIDVHAVFESVADAPQIEAGTYDAKSVSHVPTTAVSQDTSVYSVKYRAVGARCDRASDRVTVADISHYEDQGDSQAEHRDEQTVSSDDSENQGDSSGEGAMGVAGGPGEDGRIKHFVGPIVTGETPQHRKPLAPWHGQGVADTAHAHGSASANNGNEGATSDEDTSDTRDSDSEHTSGEEAPGDNTDPASAQEPEDANAPKPGEDNTPDTVPAKSSDSKSDGSETLSDGSVESSDGGEGSEDGSEDGPSSGGDDFNSGGGYVNYWSIAQLGGIVISIVALILVIVSTTRWVLKIRRVSEERKKQIEELETKLKLASSGPSNDEDPDSSDVTYGKYDMYQSEDISASLGTDFSSSLASTTSSQGKLTAEHSGHIDALTHSEPAQHDNALPQRRRARLLNRSKDTLDGSTHGADGFASHRSRGNSSLRCTSDESRFSAVSATEQTLQQQVSSETEGSRNAPGTPETRRASRSDSDQSESSALRFLRRWRMPSRGSMAGPPSRDSSAGPLTGLSDFETASFSSFDDGTPEMDERTNCDTRSGPNRQGDASWGGAVGKPPRFQIGATGGRNVPFIRNARPKRTASQSSDGGSADYPSNGTIGTPDGGFSGEGWMLPANPFGLNAQ